MKKLEHSESIEGYRHALMKFLNEYSLGAPAILTLARRAEPVVFAPGEKVLRQGEHDPHIYFLVQGRIQISIHFQDRTEVLSERGPVTLLGEISYFNNTPVTATVTVGGGDDGVFLRLSYEMFTEIIEQYPQIKPTLARIGSMRVIGQKDGFAPYSFFMDMIGWKRDRLAVNRALFPYLEDTIVGKLLPALGEHFRMLDVGDGPGIVSEIIHERHPEHLERLFLQATHLEDAILSPLQSFPSDLTRAKFLREKFTAIVALQTFEHLGPNEVSWQFEQASRLLEEGGVLLAIRLRLVDIIRSGEKGTSYLVFNDLESLVEEYCPGALSSGHLVQVTFVDADIDPMMEWNSAFCDRVIDKGLEVPTGARGVEKTLLQVLLDQARLREFNPEEIQFHWLAWHASHFGFELEDSSQNPEVGFFFQLYRCRSNDPRT
jgi:hypothetical protein